MATFTESFNKADGALGPDLTWAPQVLPSAAAWEVTSNAASPRGAVRGLVEYARAEHDAAGSDMYAEADITALSSASQGGPCVRFTTATDATCYFLEIFGDGHVQIQKVIAGTRTNLLSQNVALGTLPGRLRLEVQGSTLTAYWRGVQVAQTTDTDIAAGTRGGLAGFEQGGQGLGFVVDSFETGDLGAGGVTGSLSVTETADSLAASGSVTAPAFSGTISVTEAIDVLAASGTTDAPGVDGALAVTEQADTLAAAGAHTAPAFSGALAVMEAADTLAASGTSDSDAIAGSINVAEGLDTLAAAGTFTPGIVSGVLNVVEEADILTAAGTHTAPVLGTLAVVEAADQLAATGAVDNSGVVAPTPPERCYAVPAEPRVLLVPAEPRTLTIPREDRLELVPA